jgi:DNA mismatch endonuclease (patch repair protein)
MIDGFTRRSESPNETELSHRWRRRAWQTSRTTAKRSAVMARIRGRNNKDTELRMVELLRQHGLVGWRRGQAVFGRPDFVFQRQRVALFVDGCFWHRHPHCKFSYTPKSRRDFWLPKFARTITRDRIVTGTLKRAGWKVVRIWECELNEKDATRPIRRIRRALTEPKA